MWVGDIGNHRVVKLSSEGKVIDQWVTSDLPLGGRYLALDANEEKLWVADSDNARVVVFDLNPTALSAASEVKSVVPERSSAL